MNNFNNLDIFKNNLKSLKYCSFDDNGDFMTSLEILSIWFDNVKKQYFENFGLSYQTSQSVDSIFITENTVVFIEFKNGKVGNIAKDVKGKAKDSLLIFNDLTNTTLSFSRDNIIYVVVYNESKNPKLSKTSSKNRISEYLSNKSNEERIYFDLTKYKKAYFKDIHTYNEQEFNDYINELVAN